MYHVSLFSGIGGIDLAAEWAGFTTVALGGQLNPDWVEWLMGFPIGWTNLNISPESLQE